MQHYNTVNQNPTWQKLNNANQRRLIRAKFIIICTTCQVQPLLCFVFFSILKLYRRVNNLFFFSVTQIAHSATLLNRLLKIIKKKKKKKEVFNELPSCYSLLYTCYFVFKTKIYIVDFLH